MKMKLFFLSLLLIFIYCGAATAQETLTPITKHNTLSSSRVKHEILYSEDLNFYLASSSGGIDRGNNNELPLIISTKEGNYSAVKEMVENKADVNITDKAGMTPLMYAAYYNYIKIASFLINHGAEVNKVDTYAASALHKACLRGNYDVVKLLLDNNANPNLKMDNNMTPLMAAVIVGQKDIVKLLISRGVNVNDRKICDFCSMDTALMIAAGKGNIQILKLLLLNGAIVNEQNRDGETALFFAIRKGNINAVEALIAWKANLKILNNNNQSPLDVALKLKADEIIPLLKSP